MSVGFMAIAAAANSLILFWNQLFELTPSPDMKTKKDEIKTSQKRNKNSIVEKGLPPTPR